MMRSSWRTQLDAHFNPMSDLGTQSTPDYSASWMSLSLTAAPDYSSYTPEQRLAAVKEFRVFFCAGHYFNDSLEPPEIPKASSPERLTELYHLREQWKVGIARSGLAWKMNLFDRVREDMKAAPAETQ